MGTRINPGRFDCHAAALPDEPQFTLLARDPLAGFLVSIWSSLRLGADIEGAQAKFRKMAEAAASRYWTDPDVDKAAEALDCALEMFRWREDNEGRWRQPIEQAAFRIRSASAELGDDGLIEVTIYETRDGGPVKHFTPADFLLLDEAHATELLGTLALALEKRRQQAADGATA